MSCSEQAGEGLSRDITATSTAPALLDLPVDERRVLRARGALLAVISLGALLAGLVSVRGATRGVLPDFVAAVHYPARALLDGVNPYDVEAFLQTYPVEGAYFPLYAPSHLLLSLPFGLVPPRAASVLWLLITAGLLVCLVRLGSRGWQITALLLGLVLLSRPGRSDVLLGQVALPYVLVTCLAWRWSRTRPRAAAGCLAVALGKPTFGLALLALLLVRRQWRTAALGTLGGALLSLVPAAVLLTAHGGEALDAVEGNLDKAQSDSASTPGASRLVDGLSLVVRVVSPDGDVSGAWTGVAYLVAVALAGVVLAVAARREPTHEEAALLVLLAAVTLLCLPHQAYDALLLVWPAAAAASAWRQHPVLALSVSAVVLALLVPSRTLLRLLGYEAEPGVDEARDPGLGAVESVTSALLVVAAVVAAAVLSTRGRRKDAAAQA